MPAPVTTGIPSLLVADNRVPLFSRRRAVELRPHPLMQISAVGDVMLAGRLAGVIERYGADYPFAATSSLLKSVDLALANLEAPFTDLGSRFAGKQFTFRVSPAWGKALAGAGIDVVTLANNHILDYGCDGLAQTEQVLRDLDIAFCGAGSNRERACSATVVSRFGVRTAFLGYSMTYPEDFWAGPESCGTCFPTPGLMREGIAQARESADLVVVSFHWSAEKRTRPKPYQIEYAHRAIDLGADLVIGHHPHVLQGFELYKGRLIAYSLGNYVFGSLSRTARTSVILQVMLSPAGLQIARLVPICVDNYRVHFQPAEVTGEEGRALLAELDALSLDLNGGRHLISTDGYIIPPPFGCAGRDLTAE